MGRRRAALTAALALLCGLAMIVPAATASGDHRAPAGASSDVGSQLSKASKGSKDHEHPPGTFQNSIIEAAHLARETDGAPPTDSTLPTGFSDQKVITGMSEAVSADFAPDGTAFVALKTGQVKVAEYNAATNSWGAATDFADLQPKVNNYGDRGLTGIAVDPQFPTRPYVYVNYTYDKDPRDGTGGVVPKWGVGTAYDDCPTPATEANPSIAGCIVQDRVTRLTASHTSGSWVMTQEKELLVSGCYQFSSHASGDVAFGPDGKLYASSGEGASFNTQDYGQYANPCPDDPADEGGSLRSQDFRTAGDALGVDGSVFRMNPDSGIVPTQANASQWLVAYGQRNPWRLAFRPKADGTGLSNELWSGDVGASKAEEVNRIADVTAVTTPVNRGWPCYEGDYTQSQIQPAWDALNKSLCETLYPQGQGVVQKPVFSYQTRDGGPLVPGEDCFNETSSVSGIAFGTAQSNYPAAYKGAMFFSDFARSCIWSLGKKADGEPDPAVIQNFVQAASTPVDLLTGPGGDLYYVDYGINPDGTVGQGIAGVHRIVYTGSNGVPTARIAANPASGAAPLAVTFSGSTSTDPDGDPLTYRWDFDNNGTWDQTGGVTAAHTYAAGTWTAKLEVNDGHGHTATATQQIQAGNTAPTLGTVTPTASLTWAVGDQISYSATATDQQQTLPSSAFSWQLEIRHCPSDVCHSHPFGTFTGATGSLTAPPHEYPSHLLLTVTVTDSGGLTDSRTVQLNPKTVQLTFASSPSGAGVTVAETAHTAPYTETFIQKSPVTVTASPTVGTGATVAAFGSWSDGGAASHLVTPGTSNATLTATYTRPTASLSANPTSGTAPLAVAYTAGATNAPGASGGFTYAWDLDSDGQYDDGTGVTQNKTYPSAGTFTVRVLATDSRGATDAKAVTVTVSPPPNQNPVPVISANPTSGHAPLVVSLSAAGSSDPDGDPLTYAWDTDADGQFDDGSAVPASATYNGVGPHTATVKVSDNRGGSATKSVVVTVTNSGPTARITTTPSPATGNAPLAVAFSGATSIDPDGGPLTYAWDLDADGQYDDSTAATVNRTYAVGAVSVGLRVTDDGGLSSTATVPVTVPNRLPVPGISADPTSGPAPLLVNLSAAGSADPDGTALTYAWDLDDDGQFDDATGVTTSRTFNGVGTHKVTVQVKDADNGTATKSVTVTVTNTGPVAHISTTPASGSGPAPLTVGFDASSSTDPDGGTLTYAWDLDGDGAYDDASGVTAAATYQVGATTVALKVTDAAGTSGTAIMTINATNTAPTVTRVTTYPSGGFYVGQTLGFDAAATDPQQALPDSAFSFTMERQDCDGGCPRVPVQTWTGVGNAQFLVPELPYPSHLYLVATATDAHGATGRSELRIDPQPTSLTVRTKKKLVTVSVDGEHRADGWTSRYVVGTTLRVVAPKRQVRKGVRYVFVRWSDRGARQHDVQLWDSAVTITAVYRRTR